MSFLSSHLQAAIERMRITGSDMQSYEVQSAVRGLPETIAETVCAFANREGGTILLGLDENNHFRSAEGFDAKRIHDTLLRLGGDFTPPVRLVIEHCPFENHEIVVAVVEPAPVDQRPCYIAKKGIRSGSYIRTAGGNKRLTDYEIDRLREFHRQPSFDRRPVA